LVLRCTTTRIIVFNPSSRPGSYSKPRDHSSRRRASGERAKVGERVGVFGPQN
jgi:hypothetical protein